MLMQRSRVIVFALRALAAAELIGEGAAPAKASDTASVDTANAPAMTK